MTMTVFLAAAAAQAFDVDAATRAYLETVQGAARARSDAYFEGGYWLMLWSALVGVVVYWIMLRTGWSAAWSERSRRITRRRWLQPAIYSVPFSIVGAVLTLPWTVYSGFVREQQYGLMNLTFVAWLTEQTISLVVSIILGAIVFLVLFAVIRRAPRSWWLWGTGAAAALLALLVMISPVFIAPLFNTYMPMAPGPLRDQILAMAHKEGIPANDVYVFDQSKQTNRISANVSGIGPTIRISLNDNLLTRTSPAGVRAVMGHEMGHYVLKHVERQVVELSLLALVLLFLLWWLSPRILRRFGDPWGVHGVSDPGVAPLYAIVIVVFGLVTTPVVNTMVRTAEAEADAFGLNAAREPDGFATVAMLLSEYRKIEPGKWEEALMYDHPSGRSRVRMAMEWKGQHLDELPPDQRGIVLVTIPQLSKPR
jgi:STE24 endopeptidase